MVYTDQLGRMMELRNKPKRIVSVVPSQTELLFHLGLDEEVVGITKFCIHPEVWFRTKTRVGGTKQLNIEKIISLAPDLIIANKEENVQEQVEALAQSFPVWVSDINTLPEALDMITSIGDMVDRKETAGALSKEIEKAFQSLKVNRDTKPKTAYLIWKDPYMTVGGDTFIHQMMDYAGLSNLYAAESRYPITTIERLKEMDCEVLLLSSEPYPFGQKHIDEIKAKLPHTHILLVDGEMFSWYGSRLRYAPAYFQQLQEQIAMIS